MARARAAVKVAEPATALPTLVDDYLAHCRARGLAPNTVNQAYKYPLRGVLLPFCERHGIQDVAEIKQQHLERLAVELQDTDGAKGPRSPFTVKAYLKGINQFLAWARKRGVETPKAEMPK